MIEIDKFEVNGKAFQGIKATIPDGPPLLLIKGEKGFVMCGYLNIDVAEQLGLAAATVSGVSNFEDIINASIKKSTQKAKELGLKPGLVVKKVIGNLG